MKGVSGITKLQWDNIMEFGLNFVRKQNFSSNIFHTYKFQSND